MINCKIDGIIKNVYDEHLTLTIEKNLSFHHSIVLPFSVAKYHEMTVTNYYVQLR